MGTVLRLLPIGKIRCQPEQSSNFYSLLPSSVTIDRFQFFMNVGWNPLALRDFSLLPATCHTILLYQSQKNAVSAASMLLTSTSGPAFQRLIGLC